MSELATIEADEHKREERPLEPTLWVTDEELIRRSGVPYKTAKEAIAALDANAKSGFPKKNPLWGNRRYWPSVKAYWERVGNPQAATQPLRAQPLRGRDHHAKEANDRRSVSQGAE